MSSPIVVGAKHQEQWPELCVWKRPKTRIARLPTTFLGACLCFSFAKWTFTRHRWNSKNKENCCRRGFREVKWQQCKISHGRPGVVPAGKAGSYAPLWLIPSIMNDGGQKFEITFFSRLAENEHKPLYRNIMPNIEKLLMWHSHQRETFIPVWKRSRLSIITFRWVHRVRLDSVAFHIGRPFEDPSQIVPTYMNWN